MDQEIAAALNEFLLLSSMNWKGRTFIEAGMRARALQELSALDTEALTRLAFEVKLRDVQT